MADRPRIALPAPTSGDLEYNRQCLPAYVDAVERSGGTAAPLALSLSPADLRTAMQQCAGVLLPGSPADVRPARYGHERDPATAAADEPREQMDVLLLEDALLRGKPVLGICYGLQSINIWRGGTLVQDLAIRPIPHTAGGAVAVAHTAVIETNSALGRVIDVEESSADRERFRRLPINSSHHQAVGVPGDGLRITARCPQDGVVEAIECEAATLIMELVAVQWHPERSFDISASSRSLFRWLVGASAAFDARRP